MRSTSTVHRRPLCLALAILLIAPTAVGAQDGWDPAAVAASRDNLQHLLARFERAAESTAYSVVLRGEAEEQAARLRERLEQGDFRPGDNVYVRVERFQELTDTFTVTPDRVVDMPDIGDIPLQGVLRSELQGHVQEHVARMIRDPRVSTRSLIRLGFTGAVARPGFHVVDAQAVLSDALTAAGGTAPGAELDEIRVERGEIVILQGDAMALALARGSTLDQLGLRDGDRIHIPSGDDSLVRDIRDWLFIIPATLGLVGLLF